MYRTRVFPLCSHYTIRELGVEHLQVFSNGREGGDAGKSEVILGGACALVRTA